MEILNLLKLANEEAKEKVCCGRFEKVCPIDHDIESCQEKCAEYHRIAWDFLLNYIEVKK